MIAAELIQILEVAASRWKQSPTQVVNDHPVDSWKPGEWYEDERDVDTYSRFISESDAKKLFNSFKWIEWTGDPYTGKLVTDFNIIKLKAIIHKGINYAPHDLIVMSKLYSPEGDYIVIITTPAFKRKINDIIGN